MVEGLFTSQIYINYIPRLQNGDLLFEKSSIPNPLLHLDLRINVLSVAPDRDSLSETHIVSVRAVRHPLSRAARGGLLEHAIDLLEGQSLGLGDEEDGVDEAAQAEGAPDEEDLGAEVTLVHADHVGGDDCDDL